MNSKNTRQHLSLCVCLWALVWFKLEFYTTEERTKRGWSSLLFINSAIQRVVVLESSLQIENYV